MKTLGNEISKNPIFGFIFEMPITISTKMMRNILKTYKS